MYFFYLVKNHIRGGVNFVYERSSFKQITVHTCIFQMPTTAVVKEEKPAYSDTIGTDEEKKSCAVTSSDCAGSCAGCERVITDRFYLQVAERKWHIPCLTCSVCMTSLDSTSTCYARDGAIFCKDDYYRYWRLQLRCNVL